MNNNMHNFLYFNVSVKLFLIKKIRSSLKPWFLEQVFQTLTLNYFLHSAGWFIIHNSLSFIFPVFVNTIYQHPCYRGLKLRGLPDSTIKPISEMQVTPR